MQNNDSKNVLITGGTAGIGLAAAQELSKLGYNLTIVGRDPEKCARTSLMIQSQTQNSVDWIASDLSTLAGTKRVADEYMNRNPTLHVLVNNAGALFMKKYITPDGFEKTFALNYLSPFLLTNRLLDILENNPFSRIINVSSVAHQSVKRFNKGNIQSEKHFFGLDAYSRSKLYNLYFTYELSNKLKGLPITCNAVHPGFVNSNFAWNNGLVYKVFTYTGAYFFGRSPLKGAETIIFLATSNSVESVTGKYFIDCQERPSSRLSYDKSLSDYLWNYSINLLLG